MVDAVAEDRNEDSKNWDMRESITALGREIFRKVISLKQRKPIVNCTTESFDEFRSKLRQIKEDYVKYFKENAGKALAVMQKYGLEHSDFSLAAPKF
jgi:ABC-type sulfate transport system substrate-binding protein